MKEIKFRAWDKRDKKMRIVTRMTFGLEMTGHPLIIVHLDDGKEPVSRSINDVVLLQYIGLKDKNGKEIYKGDIVQCGEGDYQTTGQVIWKDYGCFAIEPRDFELDDPIEIISNIYENPELLEA